LLITDQYDDREIRDDTLTSYKGLNIEVAVYDSLSSLYREFFSLPQDETFVIAANQYVRIPFFAQLALEAADYPITKYGHEKIFSFRPQSVSLTRHGLLAKSETVFRYVNMLSTADFRPRYAYTRGTGLII
jgi:hypothetical protein